jgi:hypothetical protein|nr:MAG TPA: hypothetical protein [Caudoviricetes sp.]
MIDRTKADESLVKFLQTAMESLEPLDYEGNRLEGLQDVKGFEDYELDGKKFATDVAVAVTIAGLTAIGSSILIPMISNIVNYFDNSFSGVQDTVVTIPVVVSDDIPKGVRDDYCGCLEVLYGMLIKSTLDGKTRSGSGDVQRIMKTLPFLTSNDKVKVSKSIAALSDVTGRLIKEKEGLMSTNGANAVSVFLESVKEYYDDYIHSPGMEGNDEVFVKTGRSGLPTFITVECLVKNGSKLEKKKMQIGIRCIAKTITKEETVAFFVKHKHAVAEVKTATTLWQKVKNVVTLSFLRNKNSQSEASPAVTKTLESMLNAVKSIDKPFVAMLLSDEVRELLNDNGLNILNPSFVRALYAKYPILSISFFDANSDTYLVSLLQDSVFTRRSASELNSERDKYEKVIGDMVRANRLIQ